MTQDKAGDGVWLEVIGVGEFREGKVEEQTDFGWDQTVVFTLRCCGGHQNASVVPLQCG